MGEREQLQWIQRNRAKHTRMRSIADAVNRLVESVAAGARELSAAAASAIEAVVDDEFRKHCRVLRSQGGGLIVVVDDPANVYLMRMKWWGPLSEAMMRAGHRATDERIRFQAEPK